MAKPTKYDLRDAKVLRVTQEQYAKLKARHGHAWQEKVRDMVARYLENCERMRIPTLYAEDAD